MTLDQVRRLKNQLRQDRGLFAEDQRRLLENSVNEWGAAIMDQALPLFLRAVKKRGLKATGKTTPNAWGVAAFGLKGSGPSHETHLSATVTPIGKHYFVFAVFPPLTDFHSKIKWEVFDAMAKTSIVRRLRQLGVVDEPGGDEAYELKLTVKPGKEEEAMTELPSLAAQIGAVVGRTLAPKTEGAELEEADFDDALITGDELVVVSKQGSWWIAMKKGVPLTVVRGGGVGDEITWRMSDDIMGSSEGRPARLEASKKAGQFKLVPTRGPNRALVVKRKG